MVRLETEEVAECVTAMFRSPIAPERTSNAKATTVRHLYIDPPNRKLTRRDHMSFCSETEQKCYIVSKRLRPRPFGLGFVRRSVQGDLARIVHDQCRDLGRPGQRYIGTILDIANRRHFKGIVTALTFRSKFLLSNHHRPAWKSPPVLDYAFPA